MKAEWDAATYHRLSRPQRQWGFSLVANLPLRGGETVLDAGCGSGHVTAALAARLPQGRVIALDLSRNMLLQAGRELASLKPPFLLVRATLEEIPLKEALDGIFSSAALHWVPDHDRMCASLFTALKPGGWLIAQCGGGPNLALLQARVSQLIEREPFSAFFQGWKKPSHYEQPQEFERRLRQAGFIEIHTGLEPSPVFLADADEFRAYLATINLHRHLERISSRELREHFLDALAEQAAHDEPPFGLDYWRLNLRARRPA